MPILRGQKSTLATLGSGTTLTTSWSVNPQPGSTILVYVQPGGVAPTSVVDNGTTVTTFTADVSSTASNGTFIYRANNIKLPAAGSYGVTVTAGATHSMTMYGIEYIGVRPGAPHATNTGGATGTAVTTNAVVGEAGGLYFGAFTDSTSLNPETITFTAGATFTEQTRQTNGSTLWCCAVADGIVAAGGSQAMTWTLGDSIDWGAAIATYRAAIAPIVRTQAVNQSYSW